MGQVGSGGAVLWRAAAVAQGPGAGVAERGTVTEGATATARRHRRARRSLCARQGSSR